MLIFVNTSYIYYQENSQHSHFAIIFMVLDIVSFFMFFLQSLLNAGNLHIDDNELLSLIAGCCNHHMVSCIIIHFVNNVINYYCSKIVSENN